MTTGDGCWRPGAEPFLKPYRERAVAIRVMPLQIQVEAPRSAQSNDRAFDHHLVGVVLRVFGVDAARLSRRWRPLPTDSPVSPVDPHRLRVQQASVVAPAAVVE